MYSLQPIAFEPMVDKNDLDNFNVEPSSNPEIFRGAGTLREHSYGTNSWHMEIMVSDDCVAFTFFNNPNDPQDAVGLGFYLQVGNKLEGKIFAEKVLLQRIDQELFTEAQFLEMGFERADW